jgi:hypothetical protein
MKKFRDRIIHARIIDAADAIARSPAQRGKFDEILMTEEGLEAIYKRLEYIRQELDEANTIANWLWLDVFMEPIERMGSISPTNRAMTELRKAKSESTIADALSRYRQHQKGRLSLPPLPEFPDESELECSGCSGAARSARRYEEGVALICRSKLSSASSAPGAASVARQA